MHEEDHHDLENEAPAALRLGEGTILSRLLKVEPGEIESLLFSCAYFFFVLCGYYMIRPLREQIYRLLDRYSNRVREDFGDSDGLFMVAALRFMLDDPSAAYFAVDAAIRSGDRDDSARYLKALLEELLFERF